MNQSTDSRGDVMDGVDIGKAEWYARRLLQECGNDKCNCDQCNAARAILALIERTQWRPISEVTRGHRIIGASDEEGFCYIASPSWEIDAPDKVRWWIVNDIEVFPTRFLPHPNRIALDLPPAAVGQNAQGDGG